MVDLVVLEVLAVQVAQVDLEDLAVPLEVALVVLEDQEVQEALEKGLEKATLPTS